MAKYLGQDKSQEPRHLVDRSRRGSRAGGQEGTEKGRGVGVGGGGVKRGGISNTRQKERVKARLAPGTGFF